MFYLKNKYLNLFILVITIFYHSVYADEQQTLEIKAQYLVLDENKGVSKYKGNVLLSKGTLIIKADTVVLYYENKILIKALITGSPADLQHQPDNEEKIHSQANKMEFFINEDRLILTGSAFVDQGNKHFSGEQIEYDAHQGIITAEGRQHDSSNTIKTPKSRVHVIIGPNVDANDESRNENKE